MGAPVSQIRSSPAPQAPAAVAASTPAPAKPAAVKITAPIVKAKPYERPYDEIDAACEGGFADTHDDAALHKIDLGHNIKKKDQIKDDVKVDPNTGHLDKPLNKRHVGAGNGSPGIMMRVWYVALDIVGFFVHAFRNFNRHVDDDTLHHTKKALQVFSAVTKGFPVVPTFSFKAYTSLIADWPCSANAESLTALLYQVGWAYRQVDEHPGDYVRAADLAGVMKAFKENKIVVQLGIEGAFPLEFDERDFKALEHFFDAKDNGLPEGFPYPTREQLSSKIGMLSYFQSLGEQYVSLSHLVSSCFGGSDMWPSKGEGIDEHNHEGRALILMASNQGVMIDAAHLSAKGQGQLGTMVDDGDYDLPLNVSHGLLKVHGWEPDSRVTIKELLPRIQKTGGTFGVIAARVHLDGFLGFLQSIGHWFTSFFFPEADGDNYIEQMVEQMDFIRGEIGVDHITLGMDGDGFVGLPFKDYAEMLDHLIPVMKAHGYSDQDITKICRGGNWAHVIKRKEEVMKARQANGTEKTTIQDVLAPLNKFYTIKTYQDAKPAAKKGEKVDNDSPYKIVHTKAGTDETGKLYKAGETTWYYPQNR